MFGSASVALAQGPLPNCNAPDPATCGNLVINPSFERTQNGQLPIHNSFGGYVDDNGDARGSGPIIPVRHWESSIVCSWFAGSGSTPDLFNTASLSSSGLGVPCNFATSSGCTTSSTNNQGARTGNGYAGLFAFTKGNGATATTDYREYVAQKLPTPLQANRAYYASFYANLASDSHLAVPSLQLAFTNQPSLGPTTPATTSSNANLSLIPSVSGAVATIPQASWNRVQGFFTATGSETQLLIGNFAPSYSPGFTPAFSTVLGATTPTSSDLFDRAYYFIDDVVLQAVPTAGNDMLANCGDRVDLGAGCPLPPRSGAQYIWSPTTDLVANLNTLHPTLLVGPNTAPTYTLTVSIPYLLPNGQTAYHTSSSSTNIIRPTATAPLSISPTATVAYCAGSTLVLNASGGDGVNYSWSSPQLPGFSATGASITVNLVAGTMIFIVNSTTCGPATLNLTVQAQCCLIDSYREQRVRITEINGRYDASTGSPFNQGPGAIYHVTTYLDLYDLLYTLEPGVKLLMDRGAEIILFRQAGLRMNGATLTAACNDMWTGVGIWGDTRGIITEDLTNPAATLYSTVEHSKYGLSYRDYDGLAPFRISHVNFRQNRYSIEIGRQTKSALPANGMVTYCTFDSDSSAMKAPYQYQDPNKYFYSQEHISLRGDARAIAWDHNVFNHAMVGVFVPNFSGWVNLADNVFRNCYWAGVALGDIGYVVDSAPTGESEIKLTRNHFYLPPYQPQTVQRRYTQYNVGYAQPFVNQCYGALLPFVKVEAYGNTFEQAGTYSPDDWDYEFDRRRPVPDIGLRANLLYQAKNNSFARLGRGMQLSMAADAPVSVLGNTFSDCQVGLAVSTSTDRQPGSLDPSRSGRPELFSSCNTFDPNPDRNGLSTGIAIERGDPGAPPLAFVNFDDPSVPLKDLFAPNGRSPQNGSSNPAFINIDNQTGSLIRYPTFSTQATDYPAFKVGPVTFRDLGGNAVDAPGQFRSCAREGFTDTGIQPRPGNSAPTHPTSSIARLEQNVPNPCSGSTRLHYVLPAGTQQAGIMVRRGLDGMLVEELTLKATANDYVLNLQHYAPGLYFYTLTADGAPLQTKRMLVE